MIQSETAIESKPPESVASGTENDSVRRAARLVLLLALLVGLVRFVRLSQWSLWIDESLTWTDWHTGLDGGEIKNPFGYALIALFVKL